ncbi:MAG: hypothetical protein JW779_12490 [Candidatus Thorarchaeota archaeon]|nr:hypothetical protein [Candidatus Thorarchaeota archaeon]
MTENTPQQNQPRLFDRSHLRDYTLFTIGLGFIISLYYVFSGSFSNGPGRSPSPPGGFSPPADSVVMPNMPGLMYNIWPLWGQLVVPSLEGVAIAVLAITLLGISLLALKKRQYRLPALPILLTLGLVLIVLTNLIHGWTTGIADTIGAASEIYSDISKVVDPISFISNYNSLQEILSLHAQTQPPGAVLAIYLLNLIFQTPAFIAIGLSVISGILSAYFINGLYTRLFEKESARYGVFLYLLLPAVQVYYLANIYAIVATLAAGASYFYFHPNKIVSLIGIIVTVFLGTFISFLFVYIPILFLTYELLNSWSTSRNQPLSTRVFHWMLSLNKIIVAGVCIVLVYAVLYFGLGFSYVQAFLYASSLENPSGFMLLASPLDYVVTRLQDILDIVVFFGPVLSVLAYRGLKSMKLTMPLEENATKTFNLVAASLVALLLLFVTGAPKKGETARICMFVLPLLLIPVLYYLNNTAFSRAEKIKLLLLVFGQAVLLQLFGLYIW